MRRPALILVLVAAAVALTGCKKKRTYDRSSPEATLASFFDAINNKRIPADLEQFIAEPKELHLWRFRCKDQRCRSGTFRITNVGERTEYSVLLYVDFVVHGKDGGSTTRGQRSPIALEKRGARWFIKRVGRKLGAPKKPERVGRDGGVPIDGGDSSDGGGKVDSNP